jgi:hypothetical protein
VVVPFLLDFEWGSNVKIRKKYLTNIFTTTRYNEARSAARVSPMRELTASMFFKNEISATQAMVNLNSTVSSYFLMPYAQDVIEMDQPPGGRLIYIDTAYRRFYENRYAVLVHYNIKGDVQHQEVIKIESVAPDSIVSTFQLKYEYSTGDLVYPAMVCIPAIKGNSIAYMTGFVGNVTLKALEVYNPSRLPDDNFGYVPPLHEGFPVLEFSTNWKSEYKASVNGSGWIKDVGIGREVVVRDDSKFSVLNLKLVFMNRADSWKMSGFLNYIAGRLMPFWARNESNSLSPLEYSGGGGQGLTLSFSSFFKKAMLEHIKYIWVSGKNNTYEIVKVIDIDESVDYTIISLDITQMNMEDMETFHEALLVRLSKDDITETFKTTEISEMNLKVVEVEGAYE